MNNFAQNKTLVVYYSHSGNTKQVAEMIAAQTNAGIFRLEPVNAYPQDYTSVCDVAKKEIKANYLPDLKSLPEQLDTYDTIFVGTPNWWSTMAPPVATFLSQTKWSGKVLIPFCTHGGGGVGRIFSDMKKLASEAVCLDGFSVNGTQAKSSKSLINEWLKKII